MIHSMTGFGRAAGKVLDRETSVEVRTVNNRFRDINIRTPKSLATLEETIKKAVSNRLTRGRVDVWLQVDETALKKTRLKLDLDLARSYLDLLTKLKDDLDLAGEVTLAQLTEFRDIIGYDDETVDLEAFQAGLAPILAEALDGLTAMRLTEGRAIAEDFQARLDRMSRWVEEIEARRAVVLVESRTKLVARIKALTEGLELDQGRLAQEAAYLSDRADITEELVRLASHFKQFGALISQGDAVGRRLEFLLQEINREVNTIGSKTGDAAITNLVLDLKTELEKLREQVQNIE
ncbi:MAG: YicC/YloC family endoribonuclease [Pseudomonadota bacterium]